MVSAHDFHGCILAFQRLMRRVRHESPFLFDPQTSRLFPVVAASLPGRAVDIARSLNATELEVSRLMARFERLALVRRKRVDTDRRAKVIELTAKGVQAVKAMVDYDNQLVPRSLPHLSAQDIESIASGFHALAAELGEAAGVTLAGQSNFVVGQIKAARALGMLGESYLGSGIHITRYQVLYLLARVEHPLQIRELGKELPFSPSALTRELDRIEQEKLLRRQPHQLDGRGVVVELTGESRVQFQRVHELATSRLYEALSRIPESIREPFVEALRSANAQSESKAIPPALTIQRCRSKRDFQRARGELVEWLVLSNRHRDLPDQILPESRGCALVMEEEQVRAVLPDCQFALIELDPRSPLKPHELEQIEGLLCELRKLRTGR